MQENQELFNDVSEMYRFNTIVFSHTDQTPWAEAFLSRFMTQTEWVPVYLDHSMLIAVKKTPDNQSLIQKHGMTPETLTFVSRTNDFQNLLQEARFANIVQNTRLEKESYQNILHVRPDFCPALTNLATLLSREGDPLAHLYISRAQTSCL